jgi:hypothetical protein
MMEKRPITQAMRYGFAVAKALTEFSKTHRWTPDEVFDLDVPEIGIVKIGPQVPILIKENYSYWDDENSYNHSDCYRLTDEIVLVWSRENMDSWGLEESGPPGVRFNPAIFFKTIPVYEEIDEWDYKEELK